MTPTRRLAGLLVALLLTSCSATKLAYNNLDWMAGWEIDDYIDLHGPAEVLFDQRFATVWKWHRKTQLPIYAADLRGLAATAAAPLSPEQCEDIFDKAEVHAEVIVAKALPDWAEVLAALDDEQTSGFVRNLEERRKEQAEEFAEGEHWDQREKRLERMTEGVENWLDKLTPEQEKRIEAWADSLQYIPELRLKNSEETTASFVALMKSRAEPAFKDRLIALVNDPSMPSGKPLEAVRDHNRAATVALLSDLSHTLTAAQRRYFLDKLNELASDFEELASQPVD